MKYIPLTDMQLERAIEERIEEALEALTALSDESIPPELFNSLESLVESYDWTEDILNDDYSSYLDMVDDNRQGGG